MRARRPKSHDGTCMDCGDKLTRHYHAMFCLKCATARAKVSDRAGRLVRAAIRKSELPDPSTLECVDCGKPAYCYDHRDYSQPLLVEPVCQGCNIRRGPALLPEVAA